MFRLLSLVVLLLVAFGMLIFRPGRVLAGVAWVLYSPSSPFSGGDTPVWASYYLNRGAYEGPPVSVRRMEDEVRTIGIFLLSIPVALAILVVLVGR